ncbi:unnamed protein product [Arabis nemorensis]|uniref:Uncharacterized protein n=1 Tax=Arabis nemorensis TaxID=586526 RepID=A0A565CRC0_9BRAS|nr:unnamed protein product [Arabis nemorensis]
MRFLVESPVEFPAVRFLAEPLVEILLEWEQKLDDFRKLEIVDVLAKRRSSVIHCFLLSRGLFRLVGA